MKREITGTREMDFPTELDDTTIVLKYEFEETPDPEHEHPDLREMLYVRIIGIFLIVGGVEHDISDKVAERQRKVMRAAIHRHHFQDVEKEAA